MKILSIIFFASVVFFSCKGKDESSNTDKNIVVLTDTSRAAGSYLGDTGVATAPVAVAPAPVVVEPAPVRRSSGTRTSTSTGGGTVYSGSNGGTTTTAAQPPAKTGWSKSAKGAVIGGVGGAAAGAVIGKSGKGAVIGGVLGATGGYIIGRGKDKKDGRVQ